MQTYTIDELLSIVNTADNLYDIATTLAPRDSKEYRNARALSDIAYRLRHAAIIMENDPEAAELDAYMLTFAALPDLFITTAHDSEEASFALDAVTRLHANCYTVRFYFTNHAHYPQQHALDLN